MSLQINKAVFILFSIKFLDMNKENKITAHVYINNFKFVVRSDISVLEASSFIGFNISRFCYHETLSVVGTCRILLTIGKAQDAPGLRDFSKIGRAHV